MKKHIVVIDYGSGNLRSVVKALEHVAEKGTTISLSSESKALEDATHIVLPGVGAFGDCAQGLHSLTGMKEALEHAVFTDKKPFLGICVGMQLLAEQGFYCIYLLFHFLIQVAYARLCFETSRIHVHIHHF